MNYSIHASTYMNNMASSAPKHLQIAMLLSKTAQHIEDAINAAAREEFMERYEKSEKACKILHALQGLLSTSEHAEIKKTVTILRNYYEWALLEIAEFNIKNDTQKAKALKKSLLDVAESWRNIEAEEILSSQQPASMKQTSITEPISLTG